MDFLDDPNEMTPEERQVEIAAILAAGYRRLRCHLGLLAQDAIPTPPLTEKGLEVPVGSRPLCVEGLTDGESVPAEVER
jgi:hypothetical protein